MYTIIFGVFDEALQYRDMILDLLDRKCSIIDCETCTDFAQMCHGLCSVDFSKTPDKIFTAKDFEGTKIYYDPDGGMLDGYWYITLPEPHDREEKVE